MNLYILLIFKSKVILSTFLNLCWKNIDYVEILFENAFCHQENIVFAEEFGKANVRKIKIDEYFEICWFWESLNGI